MPSSAAPRTTRGRLLRVGAAVLVWALVAVPTAAGLFLGSSRDAVIAGHEAVVSPTLDSHAVVDLGPFLPSLRYPVDAPVGATIRLGRTPLTSYEALGQRYAFLAAQPEAQIAKVERIIRSQALEAALVGALLGAAPILVWVLLGPRRRAELVASRGRTARLAVAGGLALVLVGAVAVRPWRPADENLPRSWTPVEDVLPPGVPVPEEVLPLEVETGLLTGGTRRLVESAVDAYRTSLDFYAEAADDLAEVAPEIRMPEDGDTVALLVSDRHDNIGMDPVARALADLVGASILLDAGDDTSTGSEWEAFSLESLDRAFDDLDQRYLVPGNHDNGTFIAEQAVDLGFTVLDGEVVEAADGITLLGVADPRSSGLGNWRDETGLSFAEVGDRLAEVACAAQEDGTRVSTLLVHDANLGAETLRQGCADLVVAGHLHDVVGPTRVEGANGEVGHRFTTGTTGGAAYAIAIGTKPRRDATLSLVTYRDGRPIGLQSLVLSPLGRWSVGAWTPLERETLDEPVSEPVGDPVSE